MIIGVVIPAGGTGTRMGGVAKPFLPLGGKPVLQYSITAFLARSDVSQIAVALPQDYIGDAPAWLRDPRIVLVAGGKERSDSVRHGLNVLAPDVDLVLVHDAARPMVGADLIERVIRGAAQHECAIAALPASDTLHAVEAGNITTTPDRAGLWQAQTPQAFPRELLMQAHARALADKVTGTDDAALVRRIGGTVRVVMGDPDNFKITLPRDLELAELLLASRGQ